MRGCGWGSLQTRDPLGPAELRSVGQGERVGSSLGGTRFCCIENGFKVVCLGRAQYFQILPYSEMHGGLGKQALFPKETERRGAGFGCDSLSF